MSRGYVYILVNSAMPGLVKVGFTEALTPEERAKQLHTTGVPSPYTVKWKRELHSYKEAEREIHERLKDFREQRNREFFRIPLWKAELVANEVTEKYHRAETVQGPNSVPNSAALVRAILASVLLIVLGAGMFALFSYQPFAVPPPPVAQPKQPVPKIPAIAENKDDLKAVAAKAQQERELAEARVQKEREVEEARLKTEAEAEAKAQNDARVKAILADLKSPDANLRKAALRDIGVLGDRAKEAVADLVALLDDNLSRAPAAKALAGIGKAAVPELLKGMRSQNFFVRQYCAIALGQIGPDANAATATLRSVAINDPSPTVREAAEAAVRKVAPKK